MSPFFLFTSVNKKYCMKQRKPTLAAFTAIIGMLTLILAVSILAEKGHEAHLPERSGRATHEALIASGLPVGILLLLSVIAHSAGVWHRQSDHRSTMVLSGQSRCTMMDARFAMVWPMRQQVA